MGKNGMERNWEEMGQGECNGVRKEDVSMAEVDANILTCFPALIPQPGYMRTNTNYTSGSGLSKPTGLVQAYPKAREQMFPYFEEAETFPWDAVGILSALLHHCVAS